jgi:hypothetical protein
MVSKTHQTTVLVDWFDESAAGLIRLAYLLTGITAVAVYFDAGRLPATVEDVLNAALPWTLAVSVETYTYLTARRVRAAWQGVQAAVVDRDGRASAVGSLRANLGILAGLLAFSMLNQLERLAIARTPPHTALSVPGPLAYLVRAVVVPAAFLAAAFLAPLGECLPAQRQAEAHRFAAATFSVAREQWRQRLAEMSQAGKDVTGALVQLVDDPAEQREIATIHQAMFPTAVRALATSQAVPIPATTMPESMPPLDRPPTGSGLPIAAPGTGGAAKVRTSAAPDKSWGSARGPSGMEAQAPATHRIS